MTDVTKTNHSAGERADRARVCFACGQPVSEAHRYCRSCGAPIAPAHTEDDVKLDGAASVTSTRERIMLRLGEATDDELTGRGRPRLMSALVAIAVGLLVAGAAGSAMYAVRPHATHSTAARAANSASAHSHRAMSPARAATTTASVRVPPEKATTPSVRVQPATATTTRRSGRVAQPAPKTTVAPPTGTSGAAATPQYRGQFASEQNVRRPSQRVPQRRRVNRANTTLKPAGAAVHAARRRPTARLTGARHRPQAARLYASRARLARVCRVGPALGRRCVRAAYARRHRREPNRHRHSRREHLSTRPAPGLRRHLAIARRRAEMTRSAPGRTQEPGRRIARVKHRLMRAVTARPRGRVLSPTGVVSAYWKAIGAGRYARAYRLLARRYRSAVGAVRWRRSHRRHRARVVIVAIRLVARARARAVVFLDLYTRAMGPKGNPGVCNHFMGNVVVVRQRHRWRYAPDAPGTTFSRNPPVVASDPRCASLF